MTHNCSADPNQTDRIIEELMHQLAPLLGKWQGSGKGEFPTIDPFTYDEEIEFVACQGEPAIHYHQKTWDTTDKKTNREPLHSESGFIRPTEDDTIECSNAQNSGRVEVLSGTLTPPTAANTAPFLNLRSIALANDERLLQTTRKYFLEDDALRYEMDMTTNKTPDHTQHLRATLHKVK